MNEQSGILLFDVQTPVGFRVHCYQAYWLRKIVAQHPVMAERMDDVIRALTAPDEIRLSRIDEHVYLFYAQGEKRLVCAVAQQASGEGFLITAYPADKMKEGKAVWKR